jgi:hypothetical protein
MSSVSIGRAFTVLLAWLGAAGSINAHHSFLGRFDRESMIEVEGEITAVSWRNPHARFVLTTTDAAPIEWEVEGPSASLLNRLGIGRDLIEVGNRIRFAGYPPVGDKREIYARHALLADGRELLLDSRIKPRWTQSALGERSILARTEGDPSRPDLGLFRVWTLIRSGPRLIPEDVDPSFDMASYPLTEAARAAVAAFDRVADNPTHDCAPKGMPTIMEQPYPIEFEQLTDGNLALHIEEYDLVRKIYMAPNAAPVDSGPSLLGVSRGHWEGDTLVVTTNRVDWPYFDQLGIPQSDQSELFERFTPTENGARLDYRLTVTDPVNFSEPVVLEDYWIWVPEIERLPYECAAD